MVQEPHDFHGGPVTRALLSKGVDDGKHAVGVRALRGACRRDRESIAGLTRRRWRKVEESADPPELDARGVIAYIDSACRSCQHDSLG